MAHLKLSPKNNTVGICRRFWSGRAMLIACIFLSLYSCAGHYYKIENDQVELYLKKTDANIVQIAYSIDQFIPHNTQRISGSKWLARVPAIEEFSYFYIVDGAVYLPDCVYMEKDDFDSENCVFQPDK